MNIEDVLRSKGFTENGEAPVMGAAMDVQLRFVELIDAVFGKLRPRISVFGTVFQLDQHVIYYDDDDECIACLKPGSVLADSLSVVAGSLNGERRLDHSELDGLLLRIKTGFETDCSVASSIRGEARVSKSDSKGRTEQDRLRGAADLSRDPPAASLVASNAQITECSKPPADDDMRLVRAAIPHLSASRGNSGHCSSTTSLGSIPYLEHARTRQSPRSTCIPPVQEIVGQACLCTRFDADEACRVIHPEHARHLLSADSVRDGSYHVSYYIS